MTFAKKLYNQTTKLNYPINVIEIPQTGCAENFDKRLQAKEPRLAKNTRKFIQRLKQAGKLEDAAIVREKALRQKVDRRALAAEELNKTITDMICEDDPVKEAVGQVKIAWLLSAVGVIETPEQRKEEILEILDNQPPHLQPVIEKLLPTIRDEVKSFLPLTG